MLGLPYIPREKRNVKPCKSFAFGCDLEFNVPFSWDATLCRHPVAWAVGTGEKTVFRFYEALFRHLTQRHPQTVDLEKCAEHVKDLTSRIMRIYAYPVAYGGFNDIWRCQLRHKWLPPKTVAVKAIRPVIANEDEFRVKQKAVEQELKVWYGLRHRNVLPLWGITNGFGRLPAFVCPWADNGTLSEYLEKFESQLDLKKRMTLLGDIADGLQYLHSRNIMHGDLSGTNILITKSGQACLSDFGLSTLFEQVPDTVAPGICFPGNIRWAAPELLGKCEEGGEEELPSQTLSQQADIYSFGSIMLQTLSGKLPFHGVQRIAQIVIMISNGYQPPREPGWDGNAIPDTLWEFVETCWARPHARPSSKKVVSFIKSQLSQL